MRVLVRLKISGSKSKRTLNSSRILIKLTSPSPIIPAKPFCVVRPRAGAAAADAA
uniref:Uncharacterized protein n=1 Tax=Arundo donax TaxID=35708 RepID=A0A0A9CSW4_ARUDO